MKSLVLIIFMMSSFAYADDHLPTSFKHTEVSPGIFYLEGIGGKMSIGAVSLLVGKEYIVLIDGSLTSLGPALIKKIKELAKRPVDFVINTHVHGDHTGTNKLQAEKGAIIVGHDNLRERMKSNLQKDHYPEALPIITFSENITFHINDHEAYVFHLAAAHTDGDAAILFREANVIATGDMLFRGIFPFIDLDSGGSVEGYKKGMKKIIDMADDKTIIMPGHGPIASLKDLKKDFAMLLDSESRVKALLNEGLHEEAIIKADPLAKYHDEYNWSFITTEIMTRTLIQSLIKN
ncbi:MAG: NADPH-quinone reductase [Gammaproteobacteria bacterium]|nr:NADPH-quinone reductase [Gammaproteobacteria bacterium]|tara:strand:- start:6344 stop:7219 length:876 start_codon:yes stop_codon:yes gene_type:complete